jgi:hypothetical protein
MLKDIFLPFFLLFFFERSQRVNVESSSFCVVAAINKQAQPFRFLFFSLHFSFIFIIIMSSVSLYMPVSSVFRSSVALLAATADERALASKMRSAAYEKKMLQRCVSLQNVLARTYFVFFFFFFFFF